MITRRAGNSKILRNFIFLFDVKYSKICKAKSYTNISIIIINVCSIICFDKTNTDRKINLVILSAFIPW
jgi:hypothetical protein